MNHMKKSIEKKSNGALTTSGMFGNNNLNLSGDQGAIDTLFKGYKNVDIGENLLTDDLLKVLLKGGNISPSKDNVDYLRGLFNKRTEDEIKAMDKIHMDFMQNHLK